MVKVFSNYFIVNIIYSYYININLQKKISERTRTSSLLIQKLLLHGLSINKLISGVELFIPEIKKKLNISDPSSIIVLFRGLIECYLTYHHINIAPTDLEKEIRFKIWIQYGLRQRTKIEVTFKINKEKHERIIEEDKINIENITNEIIRSELFINLAKDKKDTFLEAIKKGWKIGFTKDTYLTYGWQELIEKTGLKKNWLQKITIFSLGMRIQQVFLFIS